MILAQAYQGSLFVPGAKPKFDGSYVGQSAGIFKSTITEKRVCVPMSDQVVVKSGDAWLRYSGQAEYKLPGKYGRLVVTGRTSTRTETLPWIWNGKEWVPPTGYKLVEFSDENVRSAD